MSSPATSTVPHPDARAADARRLVVCDLAALAVIAIEGPDAAAFLNGQLSNDVTRLTGTSWQYTSYNSPAGRVLANMVLWRAEAGRADRFLALLAADIAESIRKRLTMFVLRSKVSVTNASAQITRYGIGGEDARGLVQTLFGASPANFGVERAGSAAVLALPGARYLVATSADDADVAKALAERAIVTDCIAWQRLTIGAGVPVITAATQDKFIPQMLNWDALSGIDFRKGCYTGQEIIARTQYLGRLKERLYAFTAPASLAPGDRLYSGTFGEQPCGTVINSAPVDDGGCELLAVVQIAALDGAIHAGALDGPTLAAVPLPYEVPAAVATRTRIG